MIVTVTRMDWSNATRSTRRKNALRGTPRVDPALRQQAMQDFVAKHALTCFKCGKTNLTRAKTGRKNATSPPWAICTDCVQNKTS